MERICCCHDSKEKYRSGDFQFPAVYAREGKNTRQAEHTPNYRL